MAAVVVTATGCPELEQRVASESALRRDRGQFVVSLLLDPAAIPANANPTGSLTACGVPIRGEPLPTSDLPAERVMAVTLSRAGQVLEEGNTNQAGVAFLTSAQAGLHHLTLTTKDKVVRARLTVDLQSERTLVRGYVGVDEMDWDDDGYRTELILVAAVLPDADADRISDTGAKALWACDANGGLVFWHLGDGESERGLLREDHTVQQGTVFADRDADWIADADDPDADGDGLLDTGEARSLPCPAFTHADLHRPGSKHESMPCVMCHPAQDPVPLACHDCHDEAGRQWCSTPEETPAHHFRVDCEQCHAADEPWGWWPGGAGSRGEDHSAYPLTGGHLSVRCLGCHTTGNIAVPDDCNSCHSTDAPADHFSGPCDACHTTETWKL